jgi:hypothetical protein
MRCERRHRRFLPFRQHRIDRRPFNHSSFTFDLCFGGSFICTSIRNAFLKALVQLVNTIKWAQCICINLCLCRYDDRDAQSNRDGYSPAYNAHTCASGGLLLDREPERSRRADLPSSCSWSTARACCGVGYNLCICSSSVYYVYIILYV